MNTKKISALTKAIELVETGKAKYAWFGIDTCNCGVVAKATGDFNFNQMCKTVGGKSWRIAVNTVGENKCHITGLFLSDVQQSLKNAGFIAHEICELEFLNNHEILNKAGLSDTLNIGDKDNFLSYLRAWIELLKEQDEKESFYHPPMFYKEKPKEIIRVAIPEKITTQAKELLTTN